MAHHHLSVLFYHADFALSRTCRENYRTTAPVAPQPSSSRKSSPYRALRAPPGAALAPHKKIANRSHPATASRPTPCRPLTMTTVLSTGFPASSAAWRWLFLRQTTRPTKRLFSESRWRRGPFRWWPRRRRLFWPPDNREMSKTKGRWDAEGFCGPEALRWRSKGSLKEIPQILHFAVDRTPSGRPTIEQRT